MQQQISVVTLGVSDLARSRRFYVEGFRWKPVFENPEIVFYQMNGLMLGTWLEPALAADTGRTAGLPAARAAYGHNVLLREHVEPTISRLLAHGGALLRAAHEPPHGGYTGYVADPDGHAWEIAWNPAWAIDAEGHVTFGV